MDLVTIAAKIVKNIYPSYRLPDMVDCTVAEIIVILSRERYGIFDSYRFCGDNRWIFEIIVIIDMVITDLEKRQSAPLEPHEREEYEKSRQLNESLYLRLIDCGNIV